MADVISLAPADVRLFVALDVHKLSIVAATLPPSGGRPELERIRDDREGDPPVGGPPGRSGWSGGLATRPAPEGSRCCGC
jgi:hypothetical protein